MRKLIFIFALLISLTTRSQDLQYYRYDQDLLSKEFHRQKRDSLRKQMAENSVAILFSAPERNRSNDQDFQYHQDPNFYYLTGLTEPNSVLLIFKNLQKIEGDSANEILFLQNRDPASEFWNGRRLGSDGAKKLLGFASAFTDEKFNSAPINYNQFMKVYLLPFPKGIVDDKSDESDLYDLTEQFNKKCNQTSANIDKTSLRSWLKAMREVKEKEELVILKKAISISCEGHNEMMKAVEPDMMEYQAQAIGEYVFKLNGAEDIGYPSICGAGENSVILHYDSNRKKLKSNDVLVLDMGAEYHGYSADVTRTLPVSGKFTEEQELIYLVVYHAQEAAFKECKPGNEFSDPDKAAIAVIKQGLLDLEIIKDPKDFRKYFTHGTSHYLGLDVHDIGTYGKLKPGNVITVEPGIYIPEGSPCDPKWWNIGIRIEDDILITESGYENLSAKTPRSIEKVEEMMRLKSHYFPGKE
jgi:Xaa-Pro aminopeptidase